MLVCLTHSQADKPSNPVQYILAYLVNHYPDMCQVPRVLGYETEDGAVDACVRERGTDIHTHVLVCVSCGLVLEQLLMRSG